MSFLQVTNAVHFEVLALERVPLAVPPDHSKSWHWHISIYHLWFPISLAQQLCYITHDLLNSAITDLSHLQSHFSQCESFSVKYLVKYCTTGCNYWPVTSKDRPITRCLDSRVYVFTVTSTIAFEILKQRSAEGYLPVLLCTTTESWTSAVISLIPRSHSYYLSPLLCLEWYNGSITPRVQSGVTKLAQC